MAFLHILLTILKILGIVLLCLLALILAVLLIVLFVPVRYKVSGGYQKEVPNAKVRIRYLGWLVIAYFDLDQESKESPMNMAGGVKLLGFRILNFFPTEKEKQKSEEKKRKKEEKKRLKEEKATDIDTSVAFSTDVTTTDGNSTLSNVVDFSDGITGNDNISGFDMTGENEYIDVGGESDSDAADGEDLPDEEAIGIIEKLRLFFLSLMDLIQIVSDKIAAGLAFLADLPSDVLERTDEIRKKAHDIKRKGRLILCILEKEQTKRAITKAKSALIKILKSISPRKGYVKTRVGLDDVATTGQIAGYYGMLYGAMYPFFGKIVTLEPVFDEQVIEADAYLKGHIRPCILLRALWLYFFDKDIKHLKKALKKGGFL
ncbi:MAG: DUF2953 domain-containing protein [Lachnospiraceae bacterium]|nr:DUF2953 domain-containing protein [Lachnospiraceae bacterium]